MFLRDSWSAALSGTFYTCVDRGRRADRSDERPALETCDKDGTCYGEKYRSIIAHPRYSFDNIADGIALFHLDDHGGFMDAAMKESRHRAPLLPDSRKQRFRVPLLHPCNRGICVLFHSALPRSCTKLLWRSAPKTIAKAWCLMSTRRQPMPRSDKENHAAKADFLGQKIVGGEATLPRSLLA